MNKVKEMFAWLKFHQCSECINYTPSTLKLLIFSVLTFAFLHMYVYVFLFARALKYPIIAFFFAAIYSLLTIVPILCIWWGKNVTFSQLKNKRTTFPIIFTMIAALLLIWFHDPRRFLIMVPNDIVIKH